MDWVFGQFAGNLPVNLKGVFVIYILNVAASGVLLACVILRSSVIRRPFSRESYER